jgi:hypothetical protein
MMSSFFSTLFLGLIAAIIGATIQQRTWRHRSLEELREKERKEARDTVETISDCLDKRLQAQRTYMYKILSDELSEEDILEFKIATSSWMGTYSSNISKLYHSFERQTVIDFETIIQKPLQYSSAILARGYKLKPENLCTRDKNLFINSEGRMNLIQHDIYMFLNNLNRRIENGQIGRTQHINNIFISDHKLISRLYLIRRLLGMEGNISRA